MKLCFNSFQDFGSEDKIKWSKPTSSEVKDGHRIHILLSKVIIAFVLCNFVIDHILFIFFRL